MSSFRGIEEGLDPLLQLLRDEDVPATFFTTGDVAVKYPPTIEKIVLAGHELGCHGQTHRSFMTMDEHAAEDEIRSASETLRKFASVTSFRAPYLKFPKRFLKLLESQAFLLDSSQAKYKLSYYRSADPTTLKRVPASMTSSVLRLPTWVRDPWLSALSSPVVLFVHPWEFVDLRRERLRWDCRFNTGRVALERLRSVLQFLKRRDAVFLRIRDLAA
jgi:peptidoglycan/xylan/chitin deacetylase (PgdA/CDA1 family)